MTEAGTVEPYPETATRQEAQEQLSLYLFGADTMKGGPREFPPALDLGLFENYMRELHGQRKTISQELTPGNDVIGIKPVNMEGEGEVTKTVYYDIKTDSVGITDIVRGDLSSARSSLIDAFGDDKFPIMEMHTHPNKSLPSIIDYQFMLLGNPEARIRGVKAIAVLCPQMQILALATDETPMLAPDQLHQLLSERGEPNRQYEGTEGKYLKTLESRWKRVFNFMMASFKRNEEQIFEQFKKDIDRINQGLEPEENDKESEDKFARVSAKAERIGEKAFHKYSHYLDKTFARIRLQFARDMGIKLYTSTDFRNFVELPDQLPPS